MGRHVELVKEWKEEQKLTTVAIPKGREGGGNYHHGRGERKYPTGRHSFNQNERRPGDRYQNWEPQGHHMPRGNSDYTYSRGSGTHHYEDIEQDDSHRGDTFGSAIQNRISDPERKVVSIQTTRNIEDGFENAMSSARSSQSRDDYRNLLRTTCLLEITFSNLQCR